ncbi:hypothetical protein [Streptomyces sp. NPDC008150]|uniref:DUF6197 family protein n=1 Tax=Streptomyces sp. NPDC008150 TaxID=3364816 RepID=UPI0036E59B45
MSTTTVAPTTLADPGALNLDARMALRLADMTARLDQAAVAFEVNTAHLPGADPIPEIAAPTRLIPTSAPCPYRTSMAGLLWRSRQRIEADGWCRDAIFDEAGAICPIRAIRLEAATRWQADDACVLLLESIRRNFPNAETIPSWNAEQPNARPVLIEFGRAVELAHARSL